MPSLSVTPSVTAVDVTCPSFASLPLSCLCNSIKGYQGQSKPLYTHHYSQERKGEWAIMPRARKFYLIRFLQYLSWFPFRGGPVLRLHLKRPVLIISHTTASIPDNLALSKHRHSFYFFFPSTLYNPPLIQSSAQALLFFSELLPSSSTRFFRQPYTLPPVSVLVPPLSRVYNASFSLGPPPKGSEIQHRGQAWSPSLRRGTSSGNTTRPIV